MTNTPRLKFWFDFASSYSYPVAARIEAQAQAAGVAVDWTPFLLGPIFAAQGWDNSPFELYPAKGRYMWRDLERLCAAQNLPLRRPSHFPRGSVAAGRIAAAYAGEDWVPAFCRAVFAANFADDCDVGDETVLAGLLERLDLPAAALITGAQAPERRGKLRDHTAQAMQLGLFGAPSFTVDARHGDPELFWGGDRLASALAWAVSGPASSGLSS